MHLWHLIFAYALAIPIGLDREQSQRQFGLRTFPLVAVVTCGFMMVGMSVIESTDGEARILQGIITGIGFIGAVQFSGTKTRCPAQLQPPLSGIPVPSESLWPSIASKLPLS
jgi:hypothetical protein